MKIKLKKKQNKYAQVHVDLLRNKTLSLKAKGLGAVLESYSDDFDLSLKSVELGSTDGPKSIKTAIKELEAGYYLFRFQTHDSTGRFVTYWAFDSQRLDLNYLHLLIQELEKVELITPNNLNSPGYRNGSAVSTFTGVSLTGRGQTIDGQATSGESTTYNNNNYNNKDNKNISLFQREFEDFKSYKKYAIKKYMNKVLCVSPPGFLPHVSISMNSLGYLHNDFSQKDLTPDDAKNVWQWMFKNQYKLESSNSSELKNEFKQ